eukprot:TRINITY_DN35239_c0_g1_i2.p1 TRINITY_DN35239_c0_g1~~TRINITY_DN35239_c0_g1_i2.p1  ORF type:complete len:251 (+),score=51.64 TRINITY_DN35239_c0_g1_i2:266-1018(+)
MNMPNIGPPPGLEPEGHSISSQGAGQQPVDPTGSSNSANATSNSSDSRQPMLLWCEADPSQHAESIEALAQNFRHQRFLYFQTPVKLTRWLFEQRRGHVTPWSVLVVGWREAKPCASAIAAAKSGCTERLRPDARRPQLRHLTGTHQAAPVVNTAVSTMVVILEKVSQETRAKQWALGDGKDCGIKIHVVHSAQQLFSLVGDLLRPQQQRQPGDGQAALPAGASQLSAAHMQEAFRQHQVNPAKVTLISL